MSDAWGANDFHLDHETIFVNEKEFRALDPRRLMLRNYVSRKIFYRNRLTNIFGF